ncbi:MAG: hypothetical protein ACLQEQ_08260 [Nitrososphaerales archaeon]
MALLSVPYNIENVPHRTWMKALWMMKGDTAGARRLAKLLDESILPIVEDGEKLFGGRVTARILLEMGVAELLSKIEDRQLGRLPAKVHRRAHHWYASIPIASVRVREEPRRGTWLGLCGPDVVTWTMNGVRIPNEVIAEQTLREAAAEGISPPNGVCDRMPAVVSTGEPDGLDIEDYVKGHLRYCGRLPKGAAYLGTIRSEEDVESARQVPGSFAVQDERGEWMLFCINPVLAAHSD